MKPDGNSPLDVGVEQQVRSCEVPGCTAAAEHRAPRSRARLRDYMWLCLEHVRAYNSAWNYYAGMSEAEIEAHRRADVTWQRPSWPFGAHGADGRIDARDPFELFPGEDGPASETGERIAALDPAQRQALNVLELTPPVTKEAIKARYKELVKQLHPDANGGNKRAEERLKLVNEAYTALKAAQPI